MQITTKFDAIFSSSSLSFSNGADFVYKLLFLDAVERIILCCIPRHATSTRSTSALEGCRLYNLEKEMRVFFINDSSRADISRARSIKNVDRITVEDRFVTEHVELPYFRNSRKIRQRIIATREILARSLFALHRYFIFDIKKPGAFKLELFSHDVDTFCVSVQRYLLPLSFFFFRIRQDRNDNTDNRRLLKGQSDISSEFFSSSSSNPVPRIFPLLLSAGSSIDSDISTRFFTFPSCQFQISPAIFATFSALLFPLLTGHP